MNMYVYVYDVGSMHATHLYAHTPEPQTSTVVHGAGTSIHTERISFGLGHDANFAGNAKPCSVHRGAGVSTLRRA